MLTVVCICTLQLTSQTVTGKLVDQNGSGLAGIQLELYINPKVYNATSSSDGSFIFNDITYVQKDELLPTGYSVSDNYPNPFNPKTRIGITLPNSGSVRISLYNFLGQSVLAELERYYSAGTNFVDLELNGLPNGVYFARVTLDGKYTVTKKLMLIYGSQHLPSSINLPNIQLNKSTITNSLTLETNLDSLVATSTITGRKTFKNLPSIVSSSLNLGNFTIERFCLGLPTVTYEDKTYNTVQIGAQCWLKENLNVGTMINSYNSADSMRNNGIIEKYCFRNDTANCSKYGGLYQWDEALTYNGTEKVQGICPSGWRIPTKSEGETLKASVNNDGNALKEVGEGTGSGIGTNTSGFSALLSGHRSSYGFFEFLATSTRFWSSTKYSTTAAFFMALSSDINATSFNDVNKSYGFSIRCLKDENTIKIGSLKDQTISMNSQFGPYKILMSHVKSPLDSIEIFAASSNWELVDTNSIVLTKTKDEITLTVLPSLGKYGVTEISLVVQDKENRDSASFNLTVVASNANLSYPTILRKLDETEMTIRQNELTQMLGTKYIATLDSFGLIGHLGMLSRGRSSITTADQAISVAKNALLHFKDFTNVADTSLLTVHEATNYNPFPTNNSDWTVDFDNQSYNNLEVWRTNILLLINDVKISMDWHHYKDIFIPKVDLISKERAKRELVGKEISYYCWGPTKFTMTEESINIDSLSLSIYPLSKNDVIEFRAVWKVPIYESSSQFPSWYYFIDVLTGEIVGTEQLFIC
ncbi:MAG: T9SS type A sorting domain-containing protein [Ignavibacteriaceae bacterium]|nr:T9SS type A sorting domain-containing protein [Ignavibacteriaceae bacterium]